MTKLTAHDVARIRHLINVNRFHFDRCNLSAKEFENVEAIIDKNREATMFTDEEAEYLLIAVQELRGDLQLQIRDADTLGDIIVVSTRK